MVEHPETLPGRYFVRGSSTAVAAELVRAGDICLVRDGAGVELNRFGPGEARVSPAIGDLPRRLEFSDGAVFETDRSPGANHWLDGDSRRPWVYRLEDHWGAVLGALVLLPLLVALFVIKGLPALAEEAAYRIPAEALQQLDAHVLEGMDEYWLQPSTAEPEQVAVLERAWNGLEPGEEMHLLRRHSPMLGPNAFALPGGTVVVTDQLLAVMATQEELMAVLAHEQGHVRERHGLRNLIQTLGVTAVFATLVGDASALAESVLVAAPAALQQMSYSREFERQADAHALAQLRSREIAGSCLGSALGRLSAVGSTPRRDRKAPQEYSAPVERTAGKKETSKADAQTRGRWRRAMDYLSTHPNVQERIAASGGTVCP